VPFYAFLRGGRRKIKKAASHKIIGRVKRKDFKRPKKGVDTISFLLLYLSHILIEYEGKK